MSPTTEYKLTVWSSLPSPPDYKTQDVSAIFASETFMGTEFQDLKSKPSSCLETAALSGESFISVIQIETYTPTVARILKHCLPNFPERLLQHVVSNTSTGETFSVIPSAIENSSNIGFLMNYPMAFADEQLQVLQNGLLPIATWICEPDHNHRASTDAKKAAIVICSSAIVPQRLALHYCAACKKRWGRLQEDLLWICADLLRLFADGTQVLHTVKQNMTTYHYQIHGDTKTLSLLGLTKRLHKDTAKMITLREQLRVHLSELMRLLRPLNFSVAGDLAMRIQDHADAVMYHKETSDVILRQLENMMSLAFNIETMAQGQAVARLNTLAFAFLPISWVATLFGMTQFSISAAWYPLWASIALATVTTLAILLPRCRRLKYASPFIGYRFGWRLRDHIKHMSQKHNVTGAGFDDHLPTKTVANEYQHDTPCAPPLVSADYHAPVSSQHSSTSDTLSIYVD
ncbi:hypothetical protein ASPCAL06883 [Aspergillus calidoustus]|uniref:Uncharacterized protein n=1 Tax=Aspergillus calidoustus TaxID=454130 RepID=A0A0U5G5U4_ASPCI|nr:hypothetical protein ASPCAL06883 [Aspergillus calidoustus]